MVAFCGGGVVEDVRVEQFRVEKTEALLRFLRVAYAGEARKSEPVYWKWHYLENPNTRIDDIPLWVVASGEGIVGQLATILVPIKVGGETRPAIWILDFIVREDFRGKGLGKRLVMAAREKYPTTITLGINEQSAGLFRSMGWVEMGWIHRYQKLLYAGNGLKGAARIAPVRGLLNLMSAPMRMGGGRAAGLERYTVRTLGTFGEEFDELWERASGQWACTVRRDARRLRWQFQEQPGKRFETVGLYDKERLVGYVVLFFRKELASAEANAGTVAGSAKAAISDFFYERENGGEIVDALIEVALRRAIELRAGSLVTDVLDGFTEERLKKHGFWRIRKSPQFMACAEDAKEIIYDPQNWFLTRGDSDVSIIEEPNVE
jgi:GNAT superfamily N-acetyltransferase